MKTSKLVLASFLLTLILLPYQIVQSQYYQSSNNAGTNTRYDLIGSTNSLPIKTNSALNPQTGSCHFGITVSRTGLSGIDLSNLGVDGYIDWGQGGRNNLIADNIEYYRVVQVSDAQYDANYQGLQAKVLAYPGSVWIIGNEPDAGVLVQDHISAQSYADRFYHMATLIRSTDATAKIAFGVILMPTPVRMEYLNRSHCRYDHIGRNS